MTQEDKRLLIKDLSSRLPYKTILNIESTILGNIHSNYDEELDIIDISNLTVNYHSLDNDIKPYLFPMSSMTKEQKKEYLDICQKEWFNIITSKDMDDILAFYKGTDWLDSHHFDYRGLIDGGIAIDATNLGIYEN